MKKIFITIFTFSLLFVTYSCDRDLPYPIDQVKRGVLIDVSRVAGTEGVLYDGITTGNYKIKLTIPREQGDYSFMKNAQLLAVLQDVDGKMTSKVVMDNITQFPQEINLNIADVYNQFGQSMPSVGQTLFFTANVILNDGLVIPGWTEVTGFNNVMFAGWIIEGRAFSNNVRYSVVCGLDLDAFVGTCVVTLDEWWEDTPYEVEVTRISEDELSVEGMFDGYAENPMIIKVNTADYTVSIPRQILAPNSGMDWWGNPGYGNFNLEGTGIINACETSISFTATARVDAGSFGSVSFKLGK